MTTVIKEKTTPATPETQMINAITAMAGNPDIDVEKLERLLGVQVRMMDRQAKMAFDEALAKVQASMPRIAQNGTIKQKGGRIASKYMKYEDIDRAIRPLLAEHGFSLKHDRKDVDNKMIIITTLKHKLGHEESVQTPLPYDQPNQLKSAIQAAISTASYGKRMNVVSLFDLVADGEDGEEMQAAQSYSHISEKQAEEIKRLLQESNSDVKRFLDYVGADNVDEISASKYEKAITALKDKIKRAEQETAKENS